ncbi:Pro-resilin [Melia azedarach]|uniref:Pro-resilin n=1 Tax=Melia azedarach TaxID=155640 RepID=A0ACC1WWD9_MELAZ|nr:Pro-resilin [Melia azedarach]
MAYYCYNYHQPLFGESYQTPYSGNFDIVPSEVFMDDSSHEFSNQRFFEYNPTTPYYGAYDPPMNCSVIAYSASTFSEPKSIVYDPYNRVDYSPAATQFRISYSVSEFNEPEFEEYDPTPYGGGYDLDLTYGKPLPPSEEICYPHPSSGSSALPSKEIVVEPAAKPHIDSKPTPIKEAEPQVHASNEDERSKEYGNSPEKPSDVIKGEGKQENYCYEGNSYECYKKVPHVPSGYGLEAMDICESIFGYWPCLARYNNEGHDCPQVSKEDSSCHQWKDTADYLFGSAYPYGERRDGINNYGDPIYGYERLYQDQSLQRQVEFDEDSWMRKFNIF